MPLIADQTKIFDLVSAEYTPGKAVTGSSTTLSAGDIVQVEETAGFTFEDVAVSSNYTFVIKADAVRALKAAEAISAGDKIYYDLSETVVTKVATDNVAIGYALEAAALGDDNVLMNFDGRGITLV